jgi:hypothetical protein
MRYFLAVASILLGCASASAQDRELVVVGLGANSCSAILKNYREAPKAVSYLIISYAQGFWTGQNAMFMQARAPLVKNLAGDSEAHLKKLMAECGRRPSEDFGIIIRDYFYDLPGVKAN